MSFGNQSESTLHLSLNPLHLPNLLLHSHSSHEEQQHLTENTDPKLRVSIIKEEAKIERAIIAAIETGNGFETLKPNSGQAVPIGEHYVCVSFREESNSEYRVWEWHGHVVSYDEEDGYGQDYVYGNYFERVMKEGFGDDDEIDELGEEDDGGIIGLKGLIGQVFWRSMSVASNW